MRLNHPCVQSGSSVSVVVELPKVALSDGPSSPFSSGFKASPSGMKSLLKSVQLRVAGAAVVIAGCWDTA